MSDIPKEKTDLTRDGQGETKDSWSGDQKERGYYYDDAHGYEKYDPEKDADVEEDDESGD